MSEVVSAYLNSEVEPDRKILEGIKQIAKDKDRSLSWVTKQALILLVEQEKPGFLPVVKAD